MSCLCTGFVQQFPRFFLSIAQYLHSIFLALHSILYTRGGIAVGVVEAVGLVLGLGGVALLLWACGSRKLEEWKAAQSDTPPEKEQLDTPPEKYLPPKKEPLAVHKGVRALE